jgi:hypothetical protein
VARVATKYVDWKVFIDGIEIPWIAFTVSVGVWSGGAASFVVEPDKYLQKRLRPTSLVHVFMYDDLEEDVSSSNPDYDRYKLWWEGEVTGMNMNKSGQSRQLSIDCMGLVSFLQKTQMYALGLGGITNTHILTGSSLIESSGAATLAVRKALIPMELSPNEDTGTLGVPGVGGVTLNFGERIMNVLAYLLSYNAVGRLNTVRRDLFGKIATIKDQALGRMVPRVVAQPYFEQTLAGLQSGGSLLDLIKTMSGALFYDFVSTTGPVERTIKFGSLIDFSEYYYLGTDTLEKEQNMYAIPALNFRNDYFFTPKIYYAFPPACNTIFPEFISNLSLSRNFFDDVTRVIVSTTLGANLSVVAPDSIFRFTDRKLTPGEFWSNNVGGINQTGDSESPYINAGLNLFAAATDIEIERGILCQQVSPDFEVFSAVSNLFDLRKSDDRSRMQTLLKDIGSLSKAAVAVEEASASKERSYIYALKAIADYEYKLLRYNRSVTLQMDGHRWLVPGLPSTILDTDQSYVALITSHTFAVDAEANETSTVSFNYIRPFPEINENLVQKMDEEQGMLAENEKNLQEVESGVEEKIAQSRQGAEEIVTLLKPAIAAREDDVEGFLDLHSIKDNLEIADQIDDLRAIETKYWKEVSTSKGFDYLMRSSKQIHTAIEKNPDFSKDLKWTLFESRRLILQEMSNPGRDFGTVISANSVELATAIQKYYDQELLKTQKAALSLSPAGVAPIVGVAGASSKLKTSIGNTEFDESEFEEDYFAPPVFANMDFIDLKTSGEIYKELIGSQLLVDSAGQPKMADPSVANLKREAYKRFLEFADKMNKIFPIYNTHKSQTEWGQRIDKPDEAQSVRRWEEKTYLRRTGLLSLRKFAQTYGLEIGTETSVEPTIVEFLTLIPWEGGNSIFDKIVDEFTLKPRDVVIGGAPFATPKDRDPAIEELRKSVKDPMLFADARQELMLDYSRRHFGSRAFDGR